MGVNYSSEQKKGRRHKKGEPVARDISFSKKGEGRSPAARSFFFKGEGRTHLFIFLLKTFFFAIFKICFGHFSIKSAPFFPRKKRKTLISAKISPFQSRFQKFKMKSGALTQLIYLPYKIVTDFDKI